MTFSSRALVFSTIRTATRTGDGFTNNCEQPACLPPPGYNTGTVNRVSRGNVTTVEMWSDASATNPQITFRHQYDIFGNEVKGEVSCCSLKRFNFDNISTWYGDPSSVTDGGTTGPTLVTAYEYDFNTSFLNKVTDPNNLSILYTPDSAMRARTVTYPKLSTESANATLETFYADPFFPNKDGLVYQTRFTYLDGTTQRIEVSNQWMDGAGRTLRAGSAAGANPTSFDVVKTIYDGTGRVTQTSNPYVSNQSGEPTGTVQWTETEYDTLSRAIRVTLPDGNLIESSYNGAQTTVTDQVGRQRRSESDGLGRLTRVTEMDSAKQLNWNTDYSYDLLDNLILINQGGQIRSFKYDSLSRLLFERTPEQNATINDGTGSLWSAMYSYTSFGSISSRKDARGVIANYSYDTLNRLFNVSYQLPSPNPDNVQTTPSVTISYFDTSPKKGRVQSVTDAAGTETYDYDNLSRLKSKARTIDSRSYTSQYQFNQAGQLKKLTYPSPSLRQVSPGYDARGRLSSVTGYLNSIAYNTAQQVTSIALANGVSESYTYSADRLQLTNQTVTKAGNTLMNLTYGYNADTTTGGGTRAGNSGQLISMTGTVNNQTRSQTFNYDQVGRLAQATGYDSNGEWKRRFTYDRWGNRTKVEQWHLDQLGQNYVWCTKQNLSFALSAGAPTTNRVSTIESIDSCDASATSPPLTYDSAGNQTSDGINYDFLYDAESRMVRSTPLETSNNSDYVYDSANRRVKKVSGGVTTHYVYEGSQVIAEYNGASGALLTEYIYAGSRMIAREQGGARRYFHSDRLSTRMMTDTNGAVTGTQDNLPFGEEGGGTGEIEKHRFTSYERDSESGTDYAVNRQYSSNTGRFMRPDPVRGSSANPQSLNRYAYVANDPVNLSDPSGLIGEHVYYMGLYMFGGGFVPGISSGIDYATWGNRLANLPGFGTFWGSERAFAERIYGIRLVENRLALILQNRYQSRINALGRASEIVQGEDCANFIQELIFKASEAAQVGGGPWQTQLTIQFFIFRPDSLYALRAYETAENQNRVSDSGRSGRNGDTLTFGETTNNRTITWNNEFYGLTENQAALMIIHESLHLIPNFSDLLLANVAAQIDRSNRAFTNQGAASQYLNEVIARHCR